MSINELSEVAFAITCVLAICTAFFYFLEFAVNIMFFTFSLIGSGYFVINFLYNYFR